MIDIRQHKAVNPDPANIEIKCALEDCEIHFPYGDGWKINAGYSMPGDRNKPSRALQCEHVCCSKDHAIQAILICLQEHDNG